MAVADNVKKIIAQKGYTQKHVANIAGYDYKSFNAMLNGQLKIHDTDILRFCTALQATPNEIFGFGE